MVFRLRSLAIPLVSVAVLSGQEKDLAALSLEELMNVEVVSVRKGSSKLSRTPAAVHVVTQDDIRRSGALNLMDAIRLAPGVHVARMNGTSWAVGMRGFNNFASNKLLVMVDGRTVYNPLLSGVVWNHQMVMLEDIERIEVIRGPAGTMWGANAVCGVINVVTKRAQDTVGALASFSAGSMDPGRGSLRYGAKWGTNKAWRTWLHQEVNGPGRVPASEPRPGNWLARRSGARLDWQPTEQDQVEVQGEITALDAGVNLIRYPRPGLRQVENRETGGQAGFALAKWAHTNRRGDTTQVQTFADVQRMGFGLFDLDARTADVDVQHSVSLGEQHGLLVGGGFRANAIRAAGTRDLFFDPANRTYLVANGFVQYEWQAVPQILVLTTGVKLERYTLAGNALQPSVRVMFTPTSRQGYWAAWSGAVRAPAHTDYALRYLLGGPATGGLLSTVSGNPSIRPERMRALEVGGRWQMNRRSLIEVALFHNRYDRLNGAYQAPFPLDRESVFRMIMSGALGNPSALSPIPLVQVNGMTGTARGGEVSVHYDLSSRWRVSGSYGGAFLKTGLAKGIDRRRLTDLQTYYPDHQWQVRSFSDLGRRWSLDVEIARVGHIRHAGQLVVPGFTRADLRIERKLGAHTSLIANGANLLRPWQFEYPGETLYTGGLIGRSLSIGVRWER
ncbi:MAG: TonB-dependent receptor [Acidobacteria bacterium]|nr:TonB-dependent receptor [Acidobacteriota bacterium]